MIKWSTKKDRVTAIRQLVSILCILYFDEITKREVDLLCQIISVGEVSKEAKDSFMISHKTSKENTAQILTRLTNKGILVPKKYKTGKELHPFFTNVMDIVDGKLPKAVILMYDGGEE
jgi:hypothetical protein